MLQVHRLLLADDDLEVRLGVVELLRQPGLEVIEAESALEAIALAREQVVHAALLDVHMPGCTGLEVLSRLRLRVADLTVPCIFYSGEAAEGLQRDADAEDAAIGVAQRFLMHNHRRRPLIVADADGER